MPTRITQIENVRDNPKALKPGNGCDQSNYSDIESQGTVLKVEGTLRLKDTELLEKICRDVAGHTKCTVTLDLANISFLDSESAAVLCRMKREQGVKLEGLHLFVGKVVELAEECEKVAKYLPKPANGTRVS